MKPRFLFSPLMGAQHMAIAAVVASDGPRLEDCLARGASASLPGIDGRSLLEIAISIGHPHTMAVLATHLNDTTFMAEDETMLDGVAALDHAIAQIDALCSRLGITPEVAEEAALLELLPWLGKAQVVPADPAWKRSSEIRTWPRDTVDQAFRETLLHGHLVVFTPEAPCGTLFLSPEMAAQWAPSLFGGTRDNHDRRRLSQ